MKMKLVACLYIFLIISSTVFTKRRKLKTQSQMKNRWNKLDTTALAGTCVKTLMQAIPPQFCWIRADMNVIPTGCPDGQFRSLALCYENCTDDKYFWGGVCYQKCPAYSHDDWGVFCKSKTDASSFFKSSYIPRSITNFNPDVPCPAGYKRKPGAAHCSKDCWDVIPGYVNCGLACAASDEVCAAETIKIIFDTVVGIASFVTFVATFGASSGGTVAAKEGIKQAGQSTMKKGFKAVVKTLSGNAVAQGALKERAKNYFKKQLLTDMRDKLIAASANALIGENFCDEFFDQQMKQLNKDYTGIDPPLEKFLNVVDILDIRKIKETCEKAASNNSSSDDVACAKSVVSSIAVLDPTGLVGIAAAFMHPVCEQLAVIPEVPKNDDDYIIFYKTCFFQDEIRRIRRSRHLGPSEDEKFNVDEEYDTDRAKSWKVGKNVFGLASLTVDGIRNYKGVIGGEEEKCVLNYEGASQFYLLDPTLRGCVAIVDQIACVNRPYNKEYDIYHLGRVAFLHKNIEATFVFKNRNNQEKSITLRENEMLFGSYLTSRGIDSTIIKRITVRDI